MNLEDIFNDKDYLIIVKDVLNNSEFQKRKNYAHHGDITVYEHSLKVSYLAYKISQKMKNVKTTDIAIGGLLHDFYYNPWPEDHVKRKFLEMHCFVHASEALQNSKEYFSDFLDDVVEDIIKKHMFPLNIVPPKYKEAWLISLVDKIVSLEVLKEPQFFKCLFRLPEKAKPRSRKRVLKK